MKIIGIIPARMGASRFPGKPLFNIINRPMLGHVYERAKLYKKWSHLSIATCDKEIVDFANNNGYLSINTSTKHTRALDRVAEAITNLENIEINDEDIIVNVQGDEPMIHPEMFDVLIDPILNNNNIKATILSMPIVEESIWRNPDTVKIIHNNSGKILYTSRAAIPYSSNKFKIENNIKRIYGLFAFKWKYLKEFTNHQETYLEKLEACDSNRILDMNFSQYIAPYPFVKSYSVDSPDDISIVEKNIIQDKYWEKY